MIFLGSMMKTERIVKAMPRASTFVVSWWSSLVATSVPGLFLFYAKKKGKSKEGRSKSHVIGKRNLAVFIADDREAQRDASDLIDIVDPSSVGFDAVGR